MHQRPTALPDYLYVGPDSDGVSVFSTDALASTTERHIVSLDPGRLIPAADVRSAIDRHANVEGVVLALPGGLPDRGRLGIAGAVLQSQKRLWLYWPAERAVEAVDRERLRSLWRHRLADAALHRIGRPLHRIAAAAKRFKPGLRWIYRGSFPVRRYDLLDQLDRWILSARPVPMRHLMAQPDGSWHANAAGMYMRADFWASNISGGSYGHTCYVAKELAATSDAFVCLMTQRFSLLDDFGVTQVVVPPPVSGDINEDAIVTAPEHYYPIAKAVCEAVQPAYLYARLALGSYVPAVLSREQQIPFIVEYNGSEISMQRSFDPASPYVYEDVYLKAEELAFRQATAISVISEHVKSDLVARGVDSSRILVNPNGADLVSYAPAGLEEKACIRASLGLKTDVVVVGFTGTFGGWHGIDVLAAAIPRICAARTDVRFLVIGDGSLKPALDAAVSRAGLDDRVLRVGRVPQAEGARLLKACDLYVSPHNTHMVDSRFFGSPTKIFEYMAMAGGIVASDLEQIGEVLSPAFRESDLDRPDLTVSDQRAVLCTPGDTDEFVSAVVKLAARPEVAAALGRNARSAVAEHYSWKRHVARLWDFVAAAKTAERSRIETGDAYKQETQRQWNANPVGSESVRTAQPHTLEWFLEIERHRYGVYAPWMPSVMEFDAHAGEAVLEIGGGVGTDLAQFARHGAHVTDVDLSETHLCLAEENFRLRGLQGCFIHHDAEALPFDDAVFDLVYCNGVLHHTPNAHRAVSEIFRVLKPGGRVIAMVYAENSLHYWRNLVWDLGVKQGRLARNSMGEIMSSSVERSATGSRPLIKVYTRRRLAQLFGQFAAREMVQRQLSPELVPPALRRFLPVMERIAGWNLIIKAAKPHA